jgi:hypothetical protein
VPRHRDPDRGLLITEGHRLARQRVDATPQQMIASSASSIALPEQFDRDSSAAVPATRSSSTVMMRRQTSASRSLRSSSGASGQ